jgi:hypothetical protein
MEIIFVFDFIIFKSEFSLLSVRVCPDCIIANPTFRTIDWLTVETDVASGKNPGAKGSVGSYLSLD